MSDSSYSDLSKEKLRFEKYKVLNGKLEQEQEGRFFTLFGGTKGSYVFLLLRIMNYYTIFVSNSMDLYFSDKEYRKNIKNQIFDSKNIQHILNYFSQTLPSIELYKLRQYFDLHFERQFDELHYKCLYHYDQNNQIYSGEFLDYNALFQQPELAASQQNLVIFTKTICIDKNFHIFLDEMISSSNLLSTYRSEKMRTILHNYIDRLYLKKVFQSTRYEACYIRYSNTFGSAYEWNIESNDIKPLESWDNLTSQIDFVYKSPENQDVVDKSKYCLNVCFYKPKPKSKKPNKDLIKAYLSYFTMNNPEILDALALDFVNSILCTNYKHKNTLVTGDYDKLYKWNNLFVSENSNKPLPIIFYFCTTSNIIKDFTNAKKEEVEEQFNEFSDNNNSVRYTHRYFLINSKLKLTKKSLKEVTQIDFPYGGEYYNLELITDIERIEIIKLLIVHGWHLLNSNLTEKPNIVENNTNIFYKCLKSTDESRIPLNILHQIYSQFISDGKTDTQLQKELTEAVFKYNSVNIRNKDKEYMEELVEQAKKISLNLEKRKTKNQRSISCKIDPKFWDEINPNVKRENELARAAEFDLYLKSLSEKYAKFYDVKLPEPEEDPLKGFVPPEKIPDEDLQ